MPAVKARARWIGAAAAALLLLTPPAAHATLAFVKNPLKPVVYVAANNGSKQKRVARGTEPKVSPDGDEVAYLRPARGPLGQRQMELALAAVSGSAAPRLLAVEIEGLTTFAWSPDSDMIAAVQVEEDGRQRLNLIDLVRNTQRTVAKGYFSGASFSPDGERIVYARARNERFPFHGDVYRADVVGGKPVVLTRDHRSLEPLWGPRGQIVFVKQLGAERRKFGPKNELFLMNAEGRRVRRLTRTNVDPLLLGLTPVDWSANGRRLLAEFVGQDTSYAVAVNARTGKQRALTRDLESGFSGAALSADGRFALGATGGFEPGPDHDVAKVPFGGGRPRLLVRNAFLPDWSR